MVKFLTSLILGTCVFLLGSNYSKFYKSRVKLLKEIMVLCHVLESDIKFNKNNIALIIKNNLSKFSAELSELLTTVLINGKPFKGLKHLSASENDLLAKFLLSLGKKDVEGELNNINNYKTEFSLLVKVAEEENMKIGMLGGKLGALGGVLVVILFI